MNIGYLNDLRRFEISTLLELIPKGARVLEFGAGTGEQARYLASHGYDVVAIDLASSGYVKERVFPVQDYNGRQIPLDDESVDIIFSSNVLEHVENLPEILAEFRRILKPGGLGLHAVPTTSWRFWTFVSGPPAAAKAAARMVRELLRPTGPENRASALVRGCKGIVAPLLPIAHGTSSDGITELWAFSATAWRKRFERNGWAIFEQRPIGLFYTGNMTFGHSLRFSTRQALSKIFGSATQVFVIRPTAAC